MDQKKFQDFIDRIARRFKPSQRQHVHSAGRRIWKIVGGITLLSVVTSFVINGNELFTKKIPSVMASVSKHVLLAKTGRPYLLKRLIEDDLALSGMCAGTVLVTDFDGDGQATDMVIQLLRPDEKGSCTEDYPSSTSYALMKDSPSSGLWPKYTLLRFIARSDIGAYSQGTGDPLSFEQKGKFLVGSIYGTDSPGWVIYGYANGSMHEFGRYRPLGSLSEIEGSEPIAQIGDKLFLPTEDGIRGLEITPDGKFVEAKLTSFDIVQRNNAALVLNMFNTDPAIDAVQSKGQCALAVDPVAEASFKACGNWVTGNGVSIELKPDTTIGPPCIGELHVARITSILPMVSCDFKGFKQSQQFPWGKVLDPTAKEASIRCPVDGESESPGRFLLKVSVADAG